MSLIWSKLFIPLANYNAIISAFCMQLIEKDNKLKCLRQKSGHTKTV